MIQVTPQMRVLVARQPLDFRKGIDGTAAICRLQLERDPMTGEVFVFRNRAGTMIRALVYDGQGYWLMTKRLSSGRFGYWSSVMAGACTSIDPHQLHVLVAGGDWTRTSPANYWRKVS